MEKIRELLKHNKAWARGIEESDPGFFEKLSKMQLPRYLWIGCSDSRITPAASVGLLPGEMFVHRNIANLVIYTDANCLSVMQYAVEVLKVRHIIVCGHYGCGGIEAALKDLRFGLIDNWLRHIHDTMRKYQAELNDCRDLGEKADRLCEVNIVEQVFNVGETTIVQDAWQRGQPLGVHGWIYRITDGIYHDLGITVENPEQLNDLRAHKFHRTSEKEAGQ